jgi:hypothetical protein
MLEELPMNPAPSPFGIGRQLGAFTRLKGCSWGIESHVAIKSARLIRGVRVRRRVSLGFKDGV